MSRCFPYPPPGYEVETVVGIAESIKLQKETEKANKERRKERKREKKEKKEKSKESKDKEKKKGCCGKAHNREDRSKHDLHVHTKSTTIEQLEGSGLTEEHGQPVCVHIGGGTRSDDSSACTPDSSLKRKKPEPPFNSNQHSYSHPPHGNLLRIKLPLIKPKDQATPRREQDPCCSHSSGKPNNLATRTIPSAQEQPIDEHRKRRKSETDPRISSAKAQEKLFRELIVNWTPPEFQAEHPDEDDMEWLFKRKERQPCKHEARRCKPNEGSLSMESANVAGQPRASCLPDVDIYALPYVLPF